MLSFLIITWKIIIIFVSYYKYASDYRCILLSCFARDGRWSAQIDAKSPRKLFPPRLHFLEISGPILSGEVAVLKQRDFCSLPCASERCQQIGKRSSGASESMQVEDGCSLPHEFLEVTGVYPICTFFFLSFLFLLWFKDESLQSLEN